MNDTNENNEYNYTYSQGYVQLKKNKRLKYVIPIVGIGFILLLVPLLNILILIPLLGLNIVVSWLKRKLRLRKVGVELILLSTVVSGALFGAAIGIFMGVVCAFINYGVSRHKIMYSLVTIPLYIVIGIVSANVSLASLAMWGIIFAVVYNIFSFFLSMAMGAGRTGLIIFSITNILFNVYVFSYILPVMLKFMGVS